MNRQRSTENFVKMLRVLESATNSNPQMLEEVLRSDPALSPILMELHSIYLQFEQHRMFSKMRFIPQAHHDFRDAIARYKELWIDSWKQAMPEGELRDLLIFANVSFNSTLGNAVQDPEEDLDFGPDFAPGLHSAAEQIEGLMDYASSRANDDDDFSRAVGAWDWFEQSAGVNLKQIELRWRQLQVIPVKESVSNKHGLNETRSLYAYLDNIRIAYVAGADLAALSMCRSVTEILIRFHYFDDDNKTHLADLIKELNVNYPELSRLNLLGIVEQANKLMHYNTTYPADKWNNVRVAVVGWFTVITELINAAPTLPIQKVNLKVRPT